MHTLRKRIILAMSLTQIGAFTSALAESSADYCVQLYSEITESPPSLTLKWAANPAATSYNVYRRDGFDSGVWIQLATNLTGNTTSYLDANVTVGAGYEYLVKKQQSGANGFGLLYGGIRMPLVENRGTLVLVVDNTYASDLSNELSRLQLDLVGDGWTVLRHDVSRADTVPSVKALILADYLANSNTVKSVLLFGHVPVPYSGNVAPDGHGDHFGAWPTDAFYADMNGVWTDTTVSNAVATGRQRNVPGDGKYDQNISCSPELELGRVDLANLAWFAQPERELLRRYLNKDHNFRHQYFVAEKRGLVDDNFGSSGSSAFAACGWRDFSLFFTPSKVVAADFDTDLVTNRYLWAYGCGAGWYGGASDVDSITGLASGLRQTVFTMLFGSYFGDWDSPDNFMRASLASAPSILTCAWAGRPPWWHHLMGLGLPIGSSVRNVQNSNASGVGPYPAYAAENHVALMGDPTLRLLPVVPPANLNVSPNGGKALLDWQPSTDAGVVGYHVYRGDSDGNGFTRLSVAPVADTNFVDATVLAGTATYMVRAVKLEQTPSGSYYNQSQGVFNRLTLAGAVNHPPVVTNRALVLDEDTPTAIPLGGSDPDGDPLWIGLRVFPQYGELTGSPTNFIYVPRTNFNGNDSFVYYVGDGLTDSGTAVVSIVVKAVDDAPAATSQTIVATNNQPLSILLAAVDPEGANLIYGLVAPTGHGTLSGVPPSLVYTPTNYPYGSESLSFWSFDGGLYGTGTVSITVVDPPTARPETVTTPEDTPVTILVLTNDTDPNGDTLSVSAVPTWTSMGGFVINNGTAVTYTPYTNYNGTDSFSYTASDGHLGTATALVTVTVTPVNDPPLAVDQSVKVFSDYKNAITLSATDQDSASLSCAIVRPPAHGVMADGISNIWNNLYSVNYIPNPGFTGADSFQFAAFDGTLYSTGTVLLTVAFLNPAVPASHLTRGVDYQYYEGVFTNIPDTSLLDPVRQGWSTNIFDLSLRSRDTNIAFRFSGYIWIPQADFYSFSLSVSAGASLWIGDTPIMLDSVAATNALGYNSFGSDPIALAPGYHPLSVVYYKDHDMDSPPHLEFNMFSEKFHSRIDIGSLLYSATAKPWAVFSPTGATGGVPLTVSFDGAGSYSSNGILVGYEWDFGDGATATGPGATHRYDRVGQYTVTLTVTDSSGGRDTLSNLVSVGFQPNILTYAEPFEDYAGGATMNGRAGWRLAFDNDALVTNLDYRAMRQVGGYPLNTLTHTKVLAVSDWVTNEIAGGTNRIVTIEFMQRAIPFSALTVPKPSTQIGLALGANGHVYVLHGQPGVVTGVWSEASGVVIGTGMWMRVSVRIDYQTVDSVHGAHYARIWVNNAPLVSADAFTTNNGTGVPGGAWFALADSSRPFISALICDPGPGALLDDLLVTDIDPESVSTNGTPVRWLMDNVGITNDYDALAAEDTDSDGSPNWAERIAGTLPMDSGSAFRVISATTVSGTNWITWYGTTNWGVATPFALQRRTNMAAPWELVVTNFPRRASGTNVWGNATEPDGFPAFYRPLILP